MQATANIAISLNRGKCLHLSHLHARKYALLRDYESIIGQQKSSEFLNALMTLGR